LASLSRTTPGDDLQLFAVEHTADGIERRVMMSALVFFVNAARSTASRNR